MPNARIIKMDLKQNVIQKLNAEFGKDVKNLGKSRELYKKFQEEKNSIERSVSTHNLNMIFDIK